MIEQYGHSLALFLQTHPNWGGLITFFISFLESVAVIGTIVPGSVTMTAVGMLIGSSILPFWMTLLWATIGALLGDLLGYWLGKHYNERLRNMWPFKKHPQWLEAGESFFHKHGGKSILIGRFIGPLRSIIPLIAGLLHMPFTKFIIAAIPAAILWAIAYMLPGILLGAVSLQLPPSVATKFILILLLIIVVLSLFAWLINYFSNKIRSISVHFLKKLWQSVYSHERYHRFTSLIASKDQNDNYQQLGWLILSLVSFVLFFIISLNIFTHSEFTSLNKPIFEFLRSIRTIKIDPVVIGFTLLGDGRVLLICTLLIIGWLLFKKNHRAAIHWVITIGIALVIPNLFKFILYFPRPTGLLHVSSTSSFPSGHTFAGVMFYGFFALFANSHIKKKYRYYLYYLSGSIILLIAFSRLYLGAHWLTDILASVFLATGFLSLIILSYRRIHLPVKILQFCLFTLFTLVAVWASYFAITYQKNLYRYSLNWPSQVIDQNDWLGHLSPALPLYRENRIGKPAEPMNVQFSGDVQQLKKILVTEGFVETPQLTLFTNTIQKLSQSKSNVNTYLPSLYLNRPPILFMTKNTDKTKLVLRLWRSNVYLSETWDIIFIGNIAEYQIDQTEDKIIYSFNAIPKLLPMLDDNEWRINVIAATKIPYSLFLKKWNGKILQISAPTLY